MAVSGPLTQFHYNGHDQAVSYFSKLLSTAEKNYSTNDLEAFGLIYFLHRFGCSLEGMEFEALPDNQFLESFFKNKNLSSREAR